MQEQKVSGGKRETEVNELLHEAAEKLVKSREHVVLLVEDTAAHAAIIRRALDANIWTIEHVTRAAAALQTFEMNPHRIVLLDLSLPDGDGLQLLRRLRAVNRDAPIIVVTATDQVSVSVEAMQNGAWDYVVKADPKETAKRISAALERAWQGRLRAAESSLIEQARFVELVRAERLEAMESVVRTVCTEVNNPLSGVIAMSQLMLQHENLDTDLQQLADGIARSASQVAEVVKKLRSAEDPSSGQKQGGSSNPEPELPETAESKDS
jgi:DNA-binding response OmpR family regulator